MTTEVVVFDLGGVLVQLGGVRDFGEMIGEPNDDKVWERWLTCDWVRRYERGLCTTEEFGAGMVEAYELRFGADEFLDRFRRWPLGLISGATEMVETLSRSTRVACLSNTNELHWNHQHHAFGLAEMFPTRFLSHELGMLKPDREIYDHVVERLGGPAGTVLFLDDNAINVDGARAAGIDAHVVKGVADALALLAERGLLD